MHKQYAHALTRLTKKADEKALVDNLVTHLKAKGRMKMLPKILRELKTAAMREKIQAPMLEVAHESEKAAAAKEAAALGMEAVETVVNHDLIHGFRVRGKGTLIDRSGKQALVSIYKNITR